MHKVPGSLGKKGNFSDGFNLEPNNNLPPIICYEYIMCQTMYREENNFPILELILRLCIDLQNTTI